jgi:hypothetical protein
LVKFKQCFQVQKHICNTTYMNIGLYININHYYNATITNFLGHEKISSYIYMHHMCFKCMTFMSKQYRPMKKQISYNYYYLVVAQEVCDSCKQ